MARLGQTFDFKNCGARVNVEFGKYNGGRLRTITMPSAAIAV